MRVRAIKDLSQLVDADFFAAVAEGLGLVRKNVGRLIDGATELSDAKHAHAARVLATIAEEEASKFLILLDAIRCPRQPHDRFTRQLARFNDHLAKGLYARACMMSPGSLGQLQEYIDHHRHEYYLDGPNDVDWIFRNEVAQGREGTLYVDYVANADQHSWSDPAQFEELFVSSPEPWSVRTARYLHDAGISTPDAVSVVAEVWRGSDINVTTHWSEIARLNRTTLEVLQTCELLNEQPAEAYSWIIEQWQFPMFDLDLSLIPVKLETLRERQRNWTPDFY